MAKSDFFTIRGYNRMEQGEISHTMEDYLEMIFRCAKDGKYIRVNHLASLLNVQPPSASKMAAKLRESGMVRFEPYGIIELTVQGEKIGAELLHRHEVLNSLFCLINNSDSELELVEKIEHYFNARTIKNIEQFLKKSIR
ncbi:MAG: metal-dependent transcriptional regulator [Oscillospiraceae bacterium]|jgi:Mn-dependent DtxR family transcriptional regulator|nr:metal-dependent transcriptional regulator [Oscillospiraceae bacterium]